MDIVMPVVRGFDATRRTKRILPEARVLILTVYDDEDALARCMIGLASRAPFGKI